jgi:hypothetical protein
MFEQIWEPEIVEESDASITSSDEHSSKNIKGDHLFFLLHGFKGKKDDMSFVRSSVMKRYPESRVYVCTSLADLDFNE